MAAAVVYQGVRHGGDPPGTLFQGLKFWFSRNVPSRQRFIDEAEANGAEIVALEKDADVLLVDHARKQVAAGSHSYRYVELSLRNGSLEDLANHVAGAPSSSSRPVGSVTTASRNVRRPFTEADDQLLWDWIKPFEEKGGKSGGNEIYNQIAAAHPHHTSQSWRDRWLKYVRLQNRTVTGNPPPESDEGDDEAQEERPSPDLSRQVTPPRTKPPALSPSPPAQKNNFTKSEARLLLDAAEYIVKTPRENLDDSWTAMATEYPDHTAEEWRHFFDEIILPIYHRRISKDTKPLPENPEPLVPEAEEPVPRANAGYNRQSGATIIIDLDTVVVDRGVQTSPIASPQRSPRRKIPSSPSFQPQTPHLQQQPLSLQQQPLSFPPPTPPLQRRSLSPQQQLLSLQPQSPSLQQQSPSLQPQSPKTRLPEPNEARKRTPGRGSLSQESSESANVNVEGSVPAQTAEAEVNLVKRKREVEPGTQSSPPLPSVDEILAPKRRRKLDEPQNFEIPSTPEQTHAADSGNEAGKDQELCDVYSPTPKPRRSPRTDLERSWSPFFVPRGPEDRLTSPLTDITHQHSDPMHTSPLGIDLLGHNVLYPSSPTFSISQPDVALDEEEDDDDDDVQSGLTGFETAPEVSTIWETAPQSIASRQPSGIQTSEESLQEQTDTESALAEPEGVWDEEDERQEEDMQHDEQGKDGEEVEVEPSSSAQLSTQKQLGAEDFSLPEPEGGWGDDDDDDEEEEEEEEEESISSKEKHDDEDREPEIPETVPFSTILPTSHPRSRSRTRSLSIASITASEFHNTQSSPMPSLSIDDWLATHLSSEPSGSGARAAAESLLLRAARATSLDYALADVAYALLRAGNGLPRNTRGVWTDRDDTALLGSDAREIERVERKHGKDGVEARWAFLELYGE